MTFILVIRQAAWVLAAVTRLIHETHPLRAATTGVHIGF
ncbi:hypothetical protein SRDD_02660 [Serratia sp. DD3]|nr:hypothetical protein SRDD_02660 [Serratia sp. DD3]